MVSLIMVSFNGAELLVNCLHALKNQTFKDFEIIVIDNGSSDNTHAKIDKFLEEYVVKLPTQFIKLGENLGFSGGNVTGLQHAAGDYVALLNSDTEPTTVWLENLVKSMKNHSEVGICASKLVVHSTTSIDSAGDSFTTLLKGDKRGEGRDTAEFDQEEYVFGACAGAALYRREMLDQIGFFDEDFFLIHEDTDLNFRAQLAGWKVLYVPTAVVHHKVRSSIGVMSDTAIYYSLRNSELVRIKNVPFGVFLRCFLEFILGVIAEFLYFVIKHKRFRLYLKAKRDALKMFPCMWKKRKMIMKTRKVSNSYLLSLMTPIWRRNFIKTKFDKFLHG